LKLSLALMLRSVRISFPRQPEALAREPHAVERAGVNRERTHERPA
jgi:hypothetical protein